MKEKKMKKVMKLAASYWFLYVPLLQYFVYYLCILCATSIQTHQFFLLVQPYEKSCIYTCLNFSWSRFSCIIHLVASVA